MIINLSNLKGFIFALSGEGGDGFDGVRRRERCRGRAANFWRRRLILCVEFKIDSKRLEHELRGSPDYELREKRGG